MIKHPPVKQALITVANCALIFIAVYCTLGAIITAFSFTADMGVLFLVWQLSSLAVSVTAAIFRGRGILVLAIPGFLLFFWKITEIIDGAKYVIYSITDSFSEWLPITAFFPESNTYTDEPTVFIAAAGVIITFLLSYAICLRRSTFCTILATAPVVFLTFVITDLQADTIFLFGLIAVYLTLLISSAFYPDDYYKRGLMSFPAFLIAVVLMVTGYMIAPHENYTREEHIAYIGNQIRYAASQMGRLGQIFPFGPDEGFGWLEARDNGMWQFNTDTVNIADSGARIITDQSLLDITASEPGTFYIRGYSMQHFDGRSWSNNDEESLPIDEIKITWPSILANIFDSSNRYIDLHDQSEESKVVLHLTGQLRRERSEIVAELNNLGITGDGGQEQIENEELMRQRLEQIEGELTVLLDEFFQMYNDPIRAALINVDVGRTMPAILADFNNLSNSRTAPVQVEMDINRTGDNTQDVSYKPYYGGAFAEEYDVLNTTETFYYVTGSVHRLVQALSDSAIAYKQSSLDTIITDIDTDISIDLRGVPDILVYPNDELTNALSNYSEKLHSSGLYTQIDSNTAQELRRLATEAGIDQNADRAVLADAVAGYVKSSGSYTLAPQPVPEDEDFVLYFFETMQEGYCIHFTTAAVMMLRALDIPARFTSGYVVTVPQDRAGNNLVLTDRNAHSWVEVFYEDTGWLYLEVTPPGLYMYIPETQPHSPENYDPEPQTQITQQESDDYDPHTGDINTENGASTSTQPDTGTAGGDAGRFPAWVYNIGITVLGITVCAVVMIIRRYLVIKNREKHFMQPNTNKAVIYIWRFITRLSRGEAIPPSDIEGLALKARFSQHRLTEEERAVVVKYAKRLSYEIYMGKGDYSRLWFKYVRAMR